MHEAAYIRVKAPLSVTKRNSENRSDDPNVAMILDKNEPSAFHA